MYMGFLKNPFIFFFYFKGVHLNHSKQYTMKVSNQPSHAETRNEFAQEIKTEQLKMKYLVI